MILCKALQRGFDKINTATLYLNYATAERLVTGNKKKLRLIADLLLQKPFKNEVL